VEYSDIIDARSHWRLAGFDLDGTLVYGTTVLLHLGSKLGEVEFVQSLVSGYESYKFTNREVSTAAASKLFGGKHKDDLIKLLDDIPSLDKIQETVHILKSHEIRSVVASVTFGFASEWFAKRFGFDGSSGIELAVDSDGNYTGEVAEHFDELDKRKFMIKQCRDMAISTSEVFYIGDSRSDIPTFGLVGFSIALNANAPARAAASRAINSRSLLEAVGLVPGLL